MGIFRDIRPYHDHEVDEVLSRLVKDKAFLKLLCQFSFPRLSKVLPFLCRWLIGFWLRYKCRHINDVFDFQMVIKKFVDKVVRETMTEFTFSGLEKFDKQSSFLFISNHRDISMDPTVVNYALHQAGFDTARLAIGDNLLQAPMVADLMRLNKSFIVKRSITKFKEVFAARLHLSNYIHHSLEEDKHSVWIAQREGRAKDGNDRTDPAVIKMLFMGKKHKKVDFAEAIKALSIVPVSISYEFDPCDAAKARVLSHIDEHGKYEKDEGEDMLSIAQGIMGFKGRVHIEFGEVLSQDFSSADEVAEAIDKQIFANYQFFPSHLLAFDQLYHDMVSIDVVRVLAQVDDEVKKVFADRVESFSDELRPFVLAMYANCVKNHFSVG